MTPSAKNGRKTAVVRAGENQNQTKQLALQKEEHKIGMNETCLSPGRLEHHAQTCLQS